MHSKGFVKKSMILKFWAAFDEQSLRKKIEKRHENEGI